MDRSKTPADSLRLVTLQFDGEMELRNANGEGSFKGRLFHADPGDVIYSKIDVRNGAIGIVPDELGRVCVSAEYPVYGVDPKVADARYIQLAFRSDVFRRKINSMITQPTSAPAPTIHSTPDCGACGPAAGRNRAPESRSQDPRRRSQSRRGSDDLGNKAGIMASG